MSTLRNTMSAFTGRQLLRIELGDVAYNYTPERAATALQWGEVKHRLWPGGEMTDGERNAALCRLCGLDPARFVFDLPSSARGIGSAVSGAGGSTRGFRSVSGFIHRRGANGRPDGNPVGRVVFASEGERVREADPQDRQEFERLS